MDSDEFPYAYLDRDTYEYHHAYTVAIGDIHAHAITYRHRDEHTHLFPDKFTVVYIVTDGHGNRHAICDVYRRSNCTTN
ncbi:MAG: hypothetical protein WC822_04520 [Candidatus Paceibacterota bacterium]|jgi:hypothetical protein